MLAREAGETLSDEWADARESMEMAMFMALWSGEASGGERRRAAKRTERQPVWWPLSFAVFRVHWLNKTGDGQLYEMDLRKVLTRN